MTSPLVERLKHQWSRLTADKRRRNLLLAGAVLLCCGVIYRFYPAYQALRGGESDMSLVRQRVAKYRRVVAGKSALEARLAMAEKSLARAEAELLTGKTEALAAVDVQNTINQIVLASGVEIKSMQVLKSPEKSEGNVLYRSVPVQFSVALTIGQLKDILYKIETFPRFFLTVEWFRVNTAGSRESGQIRCDMTVAGIMKVETE